MSITIYTWGTSLSTQTGAGACTHGPDGNRLTILKVAKCPRS